MKDKSTPIVPSQPAATSSGVAKPMHVKNESSDSFSDSDPNIVNEKYWTTRIDETYLVLQRYNLSL